MNVSSPTQLSTLVVFEIDKPLRPARIDILQAARRVERLIDEGVLIADALGAYEGVEGYSKVAILPSPSGEVPTDGYAYRQILQLAWDAGQESVLVVEPHTRRGTFLYADGRREEAGTWRRISHSERHTYPGWTQVRGVTYTLV